MKRKYMCISILLAAAMTLTACGTMRETTEETEDTFRVAPNPYLDTSDLKYVGVESQNIAIGYSFENPEDMNPVVIYDKYVSADGETFCFDSLGRLVKYQNRDEFFLDDVSYLETKGTSEKMQAEKLAEIPGKVFEAVVQPDFEYTVTPAAMGYY